MNMLINAIKTVRTELENADNDFDRTDASWRLLTLQNELAREVVNHVGKAKATDWFLVHVGDQPARVIGALEHKHLASWCSRRGIPLTSVRVDEDMVNALMEIL